MTDTLKKYGIKLPLSMKEATTTIPIVDGNGKTICTVKYGQRDFDYATCIVEAVNNYRPDNGSLTNATASDLRVVKQLKTENYELYIALKNLTDAVKIHINALNTGRNEGKTLLSKTVLDALKLIKKLEQS